CRGAGLAVFIRLRREQTRSPHKNPRGSQGPRLSRHGRYGLYQATARTKIKKLCDGGKVCYTVKDSARNPYSAAVWPPPAEERGKDDETHRGALRFAAGGPSDPGGPARRGGGAGAVKHPGLLHHRRRHRPCAGGAEYGYGTPP